MLIVLLSFWNYVRSTLAYLSGMVGDMTSFCSLGELEVVGEEGVDSVSVTDCHSFNGKRNGN